MNLLNEVIGRPGTHGALRTLEQSSETSHSYEAMIHLLTECGSTDPDSTLQSLLDCNLLNLAPHGFAITQLGIRTSLLLDAIDGADLHDIWRRLSRLDPTLRNYELIRNRLTEAFLDSLVARPSFGRLYICSPWIHLEPRQENLLTHAILLAERSGPRPEILIITRPEQGALHSLPHSVCHFRHLGASIFLNQNLHTKLYIREPDQGGGYSMAILGSQNLTRSQYLELGIRIQSDSTIMRNLISYFLDLTNHSDEV